MTDTNLTVKLLSTAKVAYSSFTQVLVFYHFATLYFYSIQEGNTVCFTPQDLFGHPVTVYFAV